MLDVLIIGFQEIFFNPYTFALGLFASLLGIFLGAMPGISSTMSLAVLLPFSFVMSVPQAMVFLIGVYYGSVYGGSLSAILLNIPGTPGSMVTQLDGYPMARKGEAGQALTYALFATTFGGVVGFLSLILLSPPLAAVALHFQSPEFTALMLFGICILAYAFPGSMVLGLLSGVLGLLLGTVGLDTVTGISRLDFGVHNLQAGLHIIPIVVGVFGLAEVMQNLSMGQLHSGRIAQLGNLMPGWKRLWSTYKTAARSSFWGIIIGIIPAAGSALAVSIAYGQEKRLFQGKEEFGNGNPRGVVSAETANNTCVGSALIPMMTLGIPGDTVIAVLMGALLIHGLRPGPDLFATNPEFVGAVYSALAFTIVVTCVWAVIGIRLFVLFLSAPPRILNIAIVLLCVVGSYAAQNSFFDVFIMIVAGVAGYLMDQTGIPRAPLVIGLVLGPLLEENIRRSLMIYDSWWIFFQRPITLSLIAISLLIVVYPLLVSARAAWHRRADK